MRLGTVAAAAFLVTALIGFKPAAGQPIEAPAIQVIDGDTVAARGVTYRLVGFNAPETGRRAHCASEAALGERAASWLRSTVAAGNVQLARVPCSCRPGTEGTEFCNYGRLCAVLTMSGQDVGAIMIRRGLAVPYQCGLRSCPRAPRPWCD